MDIKKKIIRGFKRTRLIDRCLLIFMAVLMGQLIVSVFIKSQGGSAANVVDAVIRTSIAGIFGYFISANFMKGGSSVKATPKVNSKELCDEIYSVAGDISAKLSEQDNKVNTMLESQKESGNTKIQLIIITAIGLTALITLLIARHWTTLDTSSTAPLAQLRDIFCGTIGFLLGHPPEKSSG